MILARHGESAFSVRGHCNGDASACGGLTDGGREQARALGRALGGERLDLAVHTEFRRTRETAELALEGRSLAWLVVPELGDIAVGRYEGRHLDEYREWAWSAGPDDECPGGGESRTAAARRFAAGFRRVLEREERTALVVAHGLPIRYALDAAAGRVPSRRVEVVPYAQPFPLAAGALREAVEQLEAWCAAPAFA